MMAWLRSVRPITILFIGWLGAIVYAFPGYMNYDAAAQLGQARSGYYTDWHPPMMAWYWRIIEQLIHGPLPLLLLQVTLFLWGIYAVLSRRFRPRTAALVACAILWFPPVLTPMAVVWKDSQMAAWLIAGTLLAMRSTPRSRVIGLIMLVLAAGVRDNACTAMPPLVLMIAASWGARRKLVMCGLGFVVFLVVVGSAFVGNRELTRRHAWAWYDANAIHDIAGTICNAEPMTDEQVRAELVGIPLLGDTTNLQQRFCAQYNPRWWFPLSYNDHALFGQTPDGAERAARSDAWFRLVGDHTSAFLTHRWKVTKELLGLTSDGAEEPVCQTFAGQPAQLRALNHNASLSFVQRHLGRDFVKLSKTLLYRPWAYLLVGLSLFGYSVYKRDGLLVAILASGFMYEASFLLGAAGPAFRYSHWMVTCVCIAIAIIFGERIRRSAP